jgi:hypothetical protein
MNRAEAMGQLMQAAMVINQLPKDAGVISISINDCPSIHLTAEKFDQLFDGSSILRSTPYKESIHYYAERDGVEFVCVKDAPAEADSAVNEPSEAASVEVGQ